MIYALRGAITVGEDTAEAVDDAVKELMSEIFSANSLSEDEIISVIFSQTKDIRSRNAAAACRRGGFCASAPLFCVQEAEINGMMPRVIRLMVVVGHEKEGEARMVYLRRAAALRPDLKME